MNTPKFLSRSTIYFFMVLFLINTNLSIASVDTAKVMAYNVLYYGNGCQGADAEYHAYLATILKYTSPDIISLEKAASIKLTPTDEYGVAPYGFSDSILKYAFNAAFPNRYDYCTITNEAKANNISIVFFDKTKFSFANIVSTYVNGTDYNTYKLYLKTNGHTDTSYIYITPNHTKSGDDFSLVRELQVAGNLSVLKQHFNELGNHLFLGDFNSRSSEEGFYQLLTNNKDTDFQFYDPPFYPDSKINYPAKWDHNYVFSQYFTTSTRSTAGIPNSCGSVGGGKNWYDHIFISKKLTDTNNRIHYLARSYRTIGNDGQRYKISINNNNAHLNNSAPANVIDALFHMSNKYPVMIDLLLDNKKEDHASHKEKYCANRIEKQEITILSISKSEIDIYIPSELIGQELSINCSNNDGLIVLTKKKLIHDNEFKIEHDLSPGHYVIKFSGRHNLINTTSVVVE